MIELKENLKKIFERSLIASSIFMFLLIILATSAQAICWNPLLFFCLFEGELNETSSPKYSYADWIQIDRPNSECAFNQPNNCEIDFIIRNPTNEPISVPCSDFQFKNEINKPFSLKQVEKQIITTDFFANTPVKINVSYDCKQNITNDKGILSCKNINNSMKWKINSSKDKVFDADLSDKKILIEQEKIQKVNIGKNELIIIKKDNNCPIILQPNESLNFSTAYAISPFGKSYYEILFHNYTYDPWRNGTLWQDTFTNDSFINYSRSFNVTVSAGATIPNSTTTGGITGTNYSAYLGIEANLQYLWHLDGGNTSSAFNNSVLLVTGTASFYHNDTDAFSGALDGSKKSNTTNPIGTSADLKLANLTSLGGQTGSDVTIELRGIKLDRPFNASGCQLGTDIIPIATTGFGGAAGDLMLYFRCGGNFASNDGSSPNGALVLKIWDGGGYQTVNTNGTYGVQGWPANVFINVSLIFNGSRQTIIVNGVENLTDAGAYTGAVDLTEIRFFNDNVGATQSGSNMTIDEVAIFNRAKTWREYESSAGTFSTVYRNGTLYSTVINESTLLSSVVMNVNMTLEEGTNISFKICDGKYANCVNVIAGQKTLFNDILGATYIANFTTTNTANNPSLDEINLSFTTTQLSAIDFVSPTDANNTIVTRNWTYINISVSNSNIDTYIISFNGTNFTTPDVTFVNLGADGGFFYRNFTNLGEGNHSYYGWINTTTGNTNQTQNRTITIDASSLNLYNPIPVNNSFINFAIVGTYFVKFNITIDTIGASLNISVNALAHRGGVRVYEKEDSASNFIETNLTCVNSPVANQYYCSNISRNGGYATGNSIRYFFNATDITGLNIGFNATSTNPLNATIDDILPIVNRINQTGYFRSGNWTQNGNITFYVNVTDDNNQTCTVYTNTSAGGSVTNTINTTFPYISNELSLSPTQIFGDGSYLWNVTCNDSANNQQVGVQTKFHVDTLNTTISIVSPLNNTFNTSNSVKFLFNANDNNLDTCNFYSNMTSNLIENYSAPVDKLVSEGYNFSIVNVHDGNYFVNITCNDSSGRRLNNITASRTVSIDTIRPVVAINSPLNNTFNSSNSVKIIFNITELNLDACQLFSNMTGSFISNYSVNKTQLDNEGYNFSIVNVHDGSYLLNVSCNDSAGVYNQNATFYTISIDANSPTISIRSPLNNTYNDSSTVRFVFNITENNLDTCSFYSNMTGSWAVNYSATATVLNYSGYNFSINNMHDGSYLANITCNDTFTNQNNNATFYTISIDTINPTFTANYTNFTLLKINQSGGITLVITDNNVDWAWIETNITGTLTNISYANLAGSNVNGTLNLTPVRLIRNNTFTYRVWANDSSKRLNNTDIYTTTINASQLMVYIHAPENTSKINKRNIEVNFSVISLDNDVMNCSLTANGDYHNNSNGISSGNNTYTNLTTDPLSNGKSHIIAVNCSSYVPQRITTNASINISINTSSTTIIYLTVLANSSGNGLKTNISCGEKVGALMTSTYNTTSLQNFGTAGWAIMSKEQIGTTAQIKITSINTKDCQISPSQNLESYFLANYTLNISRYNVGNFNLTSQAAIEVTPGVIVSNIVLRNQSENGWFISPLMNASSNYLEQTLRFFSVYFEGDAARDFFRDDKNASFAYGINKTGSISGTEYKLIYLGLQQLQIGLVPSLNVSFKDITNNVSILNFSATIYNTTTGFSSDKSTTEGFIMFSLDQGQGFYNVRVGGQGYGNATDTITVSNLTDQITLYSNLVNSFNVVFLDEEKGVRITDLHINKTVTLDLVSDTFSANYSTRNSTLLITDLLSGNYEVRYSASDYTKRSMFFTFDNSTFIDTKFYLLNDSLDTIIVATLQDEIGNKLQGGIFSMSRLYVSNNTYEIVEMSKSNFEGAAAFTAIVNTQPYKFKVDYLNTTYGGENPASKILSSTFTFTIKLQEDFFKSLRLIKQVSHNLSVNLNSRTVNLEYKDTINILSKMCLIVDYSQSSKKTEVCNVCSTQSEGNLSCVVDNLTGYFSARAVAQTRTNFSDYNLGVLGFTLEDLQKIFNKMGLYAGVLIVGLAGLIGGLVAGAAGMIIFTGIGLIGLVMVAFTIISPEIIVGLLLIGIIVVYLINPRR